MLKLIAVAALFFSNGFLLFPGPENNSNPTNINAIENKSIYDFKVTALNGDTIDFADFRGKKILIVNTASKCGFTPQY